MLLADHTISADLKLKSRGWSMEDEMSVTTSVCKWDQHERAPLYKAARVGKVEIFKFLFQLDGVTIGVDEYLTEWTEVEDECPGVYMVILLKIPAKPTKQTLVTPLYIVIIMGDEEIVKAVLENGGGVNAKLTVDNTLIRALYIAAWRDVVKYRDEETVKTILKRGEIDINTRTQHGWYTALHLASQRSNIGIMKTLLQYGIDVNAIDNQGCTAMYHV